MPEPTRQVQSAQRGNIYFWVFMLVLALVLIGMIFERQVIVDIVKFAKVTIGAKSPKTEALPVPAPVRPVTSICEIPVRRSAVKHGASDDVGCDNIPIGSRVSVSFDAEITVLNPQPPNAFQAMVGLASGDAESKNDDLMVDHPTTLRSSLKTEVKGNPFIVKWILKTCKSQNDGNEATCNVNGTIRVSSL